MLAYKTILNQVFGYETFREGQEELIAAISSGRDALGIMPTGAGKSICFQVPALAFRGITLVVSPLISLMSDQVQALKQVGVKAAYLNSSLTARQYVQVLQNIRNNFYKIIYIAPERLVTESFLDLATELSISMVTVDEAHCLSQWGQDFRPSYLKIIEFINKLEKRPIVSAFTATATATVRDDIIKKLMLKDPFFITTGFNRKNLSFTVKKPTSKSAELNLFLKGRSDQSGIIYCATRKIVEKVHNELLIKNYAATRYHAGLSEAERKKNQEDFLFDKKKIMVATNAFGMGIDKSNVSFVVHYNMPKNLENYYQEAGRAGRDGNDATCLLMYSGQDVFTNKFLIDNSTKIDEIDDKTRQILRKKDHDLLKQITYFCTTTDCLRAYILKYFGEKTSNYCGNCSNCIESFETVDITIYAQKIMSCVKRLGERFGVKMIIDMLRGKATSKILQLNLENHKMFGLLAKLSEARLRDIINYLIMSKFLFVTSSEYPVLKLSEKSVPILLGKKNLKMKIAKETKRKKDTISSLTKVISDIDVGLFSRLKEYRKECAALERVPAFVVFSDATLTDMCRKLPTTEIEFMAVSGVGEVKMDKYGAGFMYVIKEWVANKK